MDGTTIYDALVIGAGVSGCSIARELSRLDGRFLVLEAEDDVCAGTSKASSPVKAPVTAGSNRSVHLTVPDSASSRAVAETRRGLSVGL